MTKQKILIVDDLPILRIGTAITVRSFGFEVDEAASAKEALAKVKESQYAAIIMDCHMPHMDGLECAAKIRELEKQTGRHALIIGFSSSSERDIRDQCLKAGMEEFLSKDCSAEKLREVLNNCLLEADKLTAYPKNGRAGG